MPAERIEAPLPLIRCPFCGGEAKLFFIKEEHPFVHRVGCVGECKTAFGNSYSYSEALTACEQWNQRADTKEGANLHPPTSQGVPVCPMWQQPPCGFKVYYNIDQCASCQIAVKPAPVA